MFLAEADGRRKSTRIPRVEQPAAHAATTGVTTRRRRQPATEIPSESDPESEGSGTSAGIEEVGLSEDSEIDELIRDSAPKQAATQPTGQGAETSGKRRAVAGATSSTSGEFSFIKQFSLI